MPSDLLKAGTSDQLTSVFLFFFRTVSRFFYQSRPISESDADSVDFVNDGGGIVCVARAGIKLTNINPQHEPAMFEVLPVHVCFGSTAATSVVSIIYSIVLGLNCLTKSCSFSFLNTLKRWLVTPFLFTLQVEPIIHVEDTNIKFSIELNDILHSSRLLQNVRQPAHNL